MPHSSGGGSHSGGSHSSGGHSSGGGGGGNSIGASAAKIRTHSFSGAKKFVYYTDSGPAYIYSDRPLGIKGVLHDMWVYGIVCILFLAFSTVIMFVNHEIGIIHPLSTQNDVAIKDNIGVLGSTNVLLEELNTFYKKTGISTQIITMYNDEWKPYYKNMEIMAYQEYVIRFNDEDHWLIVYSEPRVKDEKFNDWHWEGMIGDNTYLLMPAENMDRFTEEVQKNLLRTESPNKSFTDAFHNLNGYVKTHGILFPSSAWYPFVFLFAFIFGIPCLISVLSYTTIEVKGERGTELKIKGYGLSEVGGGYNGGKLETCAYCGKKYVRGANHKRCPYCRAVLPLIQYDENGDII